MMSEEAQHLLDALRKSVQVSEDHANELVLLAQVIGNAPAAATLCKMARMKRVKALELHGQIAALRIQRGMI